MDENKKKPTKAKLVIQVIAAAYLLYLAWSLRTAPAVHEGLQKFFFIIVIIAFAAAAVVLGGLSIKALVSGEYED